MFANKDKQVLTNQSLTTITLIKEMRYLHGQQRITNPTKIRIPLST